MIATQNQFLRLLTEDKEIIIPPCDGTEIFFIQGHAIFPAAADLSIQTRRMLQGETATPKTQVWVYDLLKDATYHDMVSSLGTDFPSVTLTQSQIIAFCRTYPHLIPSDITATEFLFSTNKEFIAASVSMQEEGLDIAFKYPRKLKVVKVSKGRRLIVPWKIF